LLRSNVVLGPKSAEGNHSAAGTEPAKVEASVVEHEKFLLAIFARKSTSVDPIELSATRNGHRLTAMGAAEHVNIL
jgi:hypothetical protein